MLMDVNIINDGSNRVQAPLVTTFLHNYFTAEESDQTWKTQPDDRIASSGWYAGHPHNIALIIESIGITPNDASHQGQISAVQTLWRSDTDTIPESECTHFITDTWYRLVWRVDLVNQWMDIWVNGKHLAYDRSNPTVLIKDACRWALEKDGFIMFAPYNVRSRRIARLAVWDYFISNEEVLSLGVAGDPTDVGNE